MLLVGDLGSLIRSGGRRRFVDLIDLCGVDDCMYNESYIGSLRVLVCM